MGDSAVSANWESQPTGHLCFAFVGFFVALPEVLTEKLGFRKSFGLSSIADALEFAELFVAAAFATEEAFEDLGLPD